jgi:hypothetical protein
MRIYVTALIVCCLAIANVDCHAQSDADETSYSPFTGIYLSGGIHLMNFSNLDSRLKELGYSSSENTFGLIELSYEFLSDKPTSERIVTSRLGASYFMISKDIDMGLNRSGTLHGWRILYSNILPFANSDSWRVALSLGIGVGWTYLTIVRAVHFNDFLTMGSKESSSASRPTGILQPALRGDIRFNFLGDPVIVGIEGGYSWDIRFSSTTWGTADFLHAPDDSNSGFFAKLHLGSPFPF